VALNAAAANKSAARPTIPTTIGTAASAAASHDHAIGHLAATLAHVGCTTTAVAGADFSHTPIAATVVAARAAVRSPTDENCQRLSRCNRNRAINQTAVGRFSRRADGGNRDVLHAPRDCEVLHIASIVEGFRLLLRWRVRD
jgi:hypothetical protein